MVMVPSFILWEDDYAVFSPVGQIERGAQTGIEPATGAWVTQHIGFAKAVRNMSTPVHSSAGTSPRAQSSLV